MCLPYLSSFKQPTLFDFNSAGIILSVVLLTAFFSENQAKAQLVAGEYAEITVGTDSHIGYAYSDGCHDYEHSFPNLDPYVFGMDLYVVIDSINGESDSIGVRKYPLYEETLFSEGDYIQINDGFSSNTLLYYFYNTDTVYFSIRALGTPLVANQPYDCILNSSVLVWSHGCANIARHWYSGNTDCTVLEGEIEAPITNCADATTLEPGMNWVYNYGVSANDSLDLACWNSGSSGDVQGGVWYTFTTPDVPVELNLETSSTNCDTVELSGAQIALFENCSSAPLFCASPGSGNFGQLEFGCGELPPNTTYYLLVDSYDGEEGICHLSYQVLYNCQDLGCTDPEACNFDPDAEIDDGSCLYGSACDPEFTIIIDTLDCQNYSFYLDSSPWWWDTGGLWHTADGQPLFSMGFELSFQPSEPGTYEICYSGFIDTLAVTTCVELVVDSACFNEPCASEITLSSDSSGCSLSLGIFPTPPENASYNWDLGNGITSDSGPEIEAVFEESGVYEVCVEVSTADCNNTQICDSIEILNCPVVDPILGCTDPAACNYDPEATEDDGTCAYESECIPDFILNIDTVDCNSFNIGVSPNQVFYPGDWSINGVETDDSETLNLNVNDPGIYEICYSGVVSGFNETTTCIEITVDSLCFTPCFSEVSINVDSTGCDVNFEILSTIPTDAEIGWQFGEGAPLDWSNLPYASNTYENDGNYMLAVVMNSPQCEDVTYTEQLSISCSEDDVPGCTDTLALNFNPDANTDDGSCIYDPNCLISFEISPDSVDPGGLIIQPSFDPLEAIDITWSFGDGSESNAPFPSHEYSGEGPFLLCCTATFSTADSLECTSEFCLEISGDMTENGEGSFSLSLPGPGSLSTFHSREDKSELKLWPNPNRDGILNWELANPSTSTVRLDIYASNGIMVYSEKLNPDGISNFGALYTSGFSQGFYILVLETEKHIFRSTFTVL